MGTAGGLGGGSLPTALKAYAYAPARLTQVAMYQNPHRAELRIFVSQKRPERVHKPKSSGPPQCLAQFPQGRLRSFHCSRSRGVQAQAGLLLERREAGEEEFEHTVAADDGHPASRPTHGVLRANHPEVLHGIAGVLHDPSSAAAAACSSQASPASPHGRLESGDQHVQGGVLHLQVSCLNNLQMLLLARRRTRRWAAGPGRSSAAPPQVGWEAGRCCSAHFASTRFDGGCLRCALALNSAPVTAAPRRPPPCRWPRPSLTVDAIIVAQPSAQQPHAQMLLIKRKHPPFEGHWALPGEGCCWLCVGGEVPAVNRMRHWYVSMAQRSLAAVSAEGFVRCAS